MIIHHLKKVIANGEKPVPVVASSTNQLHGLAPGGNYTVPAPSGTSSGDLLILFISIWGDVTFDLQSSGWTPAGSCQYKYAGASESSYSFSSINSGSEGIARVMLLRIPLGTLTAVGASSAMSGTTVSVPSVTTTASNSLVLCQMRSADASITYPLASGFASVLADNDAVEPSMRLMSKTYPAGATGSVSVSASSGTSNYGQLYAIAPA